MLRGGCRGRAAGLEGQWEAGRTVGPSQKPGSLALCLACSVQRGRDAGAIACIPSLQRPMLSFWSSTTSFYLHGALCPSPSPSHPVLGGTRACSMQGLQLVSNSCSHPAALLAACPVSWPAHRDYLLSRSLFPFSPLSAACCWQTAWKEKRAGTGRLQLREREMCAALPRCRASAGPGHGCFSPHQHRVGTRTCSPQPRAALGAQGQALQAVQTPGRDVSSPHPLCIPW